VTEHLGIKHARAVIGWSMGAGQTYQWATSYSEFLDIAVPFCGSAKTSLHNQVFLEGEKYALLADGKTSRLARARMVYFQPGKSIELGLQKRRKSD